MQATLEPNPEAEDHLEYRRKLYTQLGHVAHLGIPDSAINRILDNFPDWRYGARGVGSQELGYLVRTGLDRSIEIGLSPFMQDRRQLEKSEFAIKIEVPQVTGSDLRCMIDIENMLDSIRVNSPKEIERRRLKELRIKAMAADPEELVSEEEKNILALTTHHSTLDGIADALGSSASTISRRMSLLRVRFGVEDNTDLMLLAIVKGYASIDHVPSGKTSPLSESDIDVLQCLYSLDPDERQEARKVKDRYMSRWGRMFTKVGGPDETRNRHTLILYALRDEVIEPFIV